jgi:hypothetical protein
MALKIHGGERAIKDVFSNDYVFHIPPYQRQYSWTTEQVEELIDDLLAASRASDPSDPSPYFLGSIVLAKDEAAPDSQVIDGQQRLTSLTMLLAVLAELVPDGAKLLDFIQQEANEFSGAAAVSRLTLRPKDAEFFRTWVQTSGQLQGLLDVDPAQLANDAQRNIQANARLLRRRLADEPPAEVSTLAKYLLQHCFLIVVSTPDSDSAFQIFAVLNDRGLDLTFADIIKNELVGGITEPAVQEVATKAWEDAEEALGTETFGELFAHLRMIYAKTKQRASLRAEFKQYVGPAMEDREAFVHDVVVPYADRLAIIRQQSWESTTRAKDINLLLAWLQRLDNFDWIPPVLRFLYENDDADRVFEFLVRLERLAASMFIVRRGINPRIERYAKVLQAMDAGADLTDSTSPLQLTPEEQRLTRDRLNGELYLLGRPAKYVLMRLDSVISTGDAIYEHRTISVEHVLPQSPAHNSEWTRWFTEQERERWCHRVGNLVLLARRKNSQASNYDFHRKKEVYFTRDGRSSPFPLTSQVLQQSEWTPVQLERRQKELLGVLVKLWDLDGTSDPST